MKISKMSGALAIMLLLFISCSSDDEGNSNNSLTQEEISGTWFLVNYVTEDGQSNTTNGDNVSITRLTQQGKDFDFIIQFDGSTNRVTSDGSYVIETATFEENGTFIEITPSTILNQFNNLEFTLVDNSIILERAGQTNIALRVSEVENSKLLINVDYRTIAPASGNTTFAGRTTFLFGK